MTVRQVLRILLFVFLCSAAVAQAADVEFETLDRGATEAYRAKLYPSAQQQWRAALETEEARTSSELRARILFNLGNAAFRQDRPLEAVAYYSASRRLRPRDGDVQANLDYASIEAGLEPPERGNVLTSMTLGESERLVLGLTLGLFALLAAEAFFGRTFRILAAICAVVLLASLGPWVYNLTQEGRERVMVVRAAGAPLMSEPRTDSKMLLKLDPGTEHEIRDSLLEWTKVETADGIEGWTKSASVFRTDF